jgi:endonuclease-3
VFGPCGAADRRGPIPYPRGPSEFLGALPALEARDWLTRIDGVGKKTASVLLLFCFGTPLMPVDRHVERVSPRIGLIPPEPDRVHEAHVNLIIHVRRTCHARRPDCPGCPIRSSGRFVDPRAG